MDKILVKNIKSKDDLRRAFLKIRRIYGRVRSNERHYLLNDYDINQTVNDYWDEYIKQRNGTEKIASYILFNTDELYVEEGDEKLSHIFWHDHLFRDYEEIINDPSRVVIDMNENEKNCWED